MKKPFVLLISLKTGTMFRVFGSISKFKDIYRTGNKYGDCSNKITARNMKTRKPVVFSGNLKVIPIPIST